MTRFCIESVRVVCVATAAIVVCANTAVGDWPEHRGNARRTGFRSQDLVSEHWEPCWVNDFLSPPEPAWPEPARGSLWQKLESIEGRVTDDRGDVPLIATDRNGRSHILIASSANDCLVSLAPTTGEIEWRFVARGPIRYAPSIHNGVAYFGSDDGVVRAVDIADGSEVWSARIGPDMPCVIGNNRIISSHPVRTSVLVDGDSVFAAAGLFPSQGVYLVSLHTGDGQLNWRRKISQSPQGYLLCDQANLYVPTGRAQPFAVDKSTGEFLYDLPSPGGSFCMLTSEAFIAGPGNDTSLQMKPESGDARMLSFKGRQVVAGNGMIWTANGAKLVCHDMSSVAAGTDEPEWQADTRLDQSLIVSGVNQSPIALVAGGSTIQIFDATTGNLRNELQIEEGGQISYLAVSTVKSADLDSTDEILVATTESGRIYVWKGAAAEADSQWPEPVLTREIEQDADDHSLLLVERLKDELLSSNGWALLVEDQTGNLASAILQQTNLRVLSILSDSESILRQRDYFQQIGQYGHRISIWPKDSWNKAGTSPGIFNVAIELKADAVSREALLKAVTPGYGIAKRFDEEEFIRAPESQGAGSWRHQYADINNLADTGDQLIGNAAAFQLSWFGGVGPGRMPDRHLRGPAPLVSGPAMVMQGDGVLIGVDPANGTERWQLAMPAGSMRYVTPFDSGYACLDEDGTFLFVAAEGEIWKVNALTGEIVSRVAVPDEGRNWGYLAESNGDLFATTFKPTAPRTSQDRDVQYRYVDDDYNSTRPLVTSREMVRLDTDSGVIWSRAVNGVIVNGTVAIDDSFVVFIEGRSDGCVNHQTDRIPLPEIMQDAHLVCLSKESGQVVWEQPFAMAGAQNMLYAQLAGDRLVLSTSQSGQSKASYYLRVYSLQDGEEIYDISHEHVRNGLGHGEQIHHPVILTRPDGTQVIVAEPYLYDLESGERSTPEEEPADWALRRPGHSCGTISAAGNCLFFRAGNPTVLNISSGEFTALAPTRPGCWINMIPAGGRLLIPEGSASCVCKYSLQTSMGFLPVAAEDVETSLPVLPDVIPQD